MMSKPTLICLHGALGSKAQLQPLVDILTHDFEVFSMDFDGHGEQAFSEAFSMKLFADNVLRFMKQHDIQQAHFFGYSMGGYVALTLASLRPEMVQSIVTLGTKFDWNPAGAQKEIKMLNPELIEEKVPKFAHHLKQTHSGNDWKLVMYRTAQMMLDLGHGAGLKNKQLSQLEQPVLVMVGDKDNMVTQQETNSVAELLPQGNFELIKDFEHPLLKNDMVVLATHIKQFVL